MGAARRDYVGSSPYLFGPTVPRRQPHWMKTKMAAINEAMPNGFSGSSCGKNNPPEDGMRITRFHQPDLSRSCHRLVPMAIVGQIVKTQATMVTANSKSAPNA